MSKTTLYEKLNSESRRYDPELAQIRMHIDAERAEELGHIAMSGIQSLHRSDNVNHQGRAAELALRALPLISDDWNRNRKQSLKVSGGVDHRHTHMLHGQMSKDTLKLLAAHREDALPPGSEHLRVSTKVPEIVDAEVEVVSEEPGSST